MTITVITPWWDHPQLAPGYWDAVRAGRPDAVIIVDNGSYPPLRPGDFAPQRTLRLPRNRGFAYPCNLGARRSDSDGLLFLNNDIQLIEPGWCDAIRAELRPGVLVGAQLHNYLHAFVDGHGVPYLDGWCLAIMRADFSALGGWDEGYEEPSYYGDNDLCLRARAAGMKLVQIPIGLKHLGNATSRCFDVLGVTARNADRYRTRARELLWTAA